MLLGGLGACYPMGPGYRSLHQVDGQLVHSPPPPPSAYAAYLRARLAFEQEPPQLSEAQHHIEHALRLDPRDPHLWSTRAEIEERAGHADQALTSARRALAIRPGYPPAARVLARLEGAGSGSTTAATQARARQP
jgi:Flp pilus assembly protein TadD